MSGYFRQRNLVLDNLKNAGAQYLKEQTGRDVREFKSPREIE